VLGVFTLEGALVGFGSGALALLFAQGMSWGIASFQFDIGYRPCWTMSILAVSAVAVLTILTSLGASGKILRRRPAEFLREREGG
jgi:ABC-type antimicrobial peptide transport system permease subunit